MLTRRTFWSRGSEEHDPETGEVESQGVDTLSYYKAELRLQNSTISVSSGSCMGLVMGIGSLSIHSRHMNLLVSGGLTVNVQALEVKYGAPLGAESSQFLQSLLQKPISRINPHDCENLQSY